MWTNKDFDKLITFASYMDATTPEDVYGGLAMESDEATQEALLEWFYYRKLVDNDRFLRYFRRAINKYENQYYNLVRVQMTDIDPLVQNYLERQYLRSENKSDTDTSTEGGSDTITRTGNNTSTSTGNTTTSTNSETETNGTSTGTTTDTSTTNTTNNSDTKRKHGETPQSAVGVGGSMALDWTYLSSQDEDETTGTGSSASNGSTSTNGTTHDTTTAEGESETSTSVNDNGNFSERSESTKTGTRSGTHTANSSSDDRERMTGRNEAPQDLLRRARDYIETTNAFQWLTDKLDQCFMQILE